jgi:serine protease SohB
VEQVAASGGYMAACIGDTIICSPFAVVGSIGVIQEMPNVYERLKREGVEFHQVTAGDWKRVLSPTKEVTEKDLQKAKEEIEDVWKLFKDFVAEQRPSLNLDRVATGEVWFGNRAVEVGLCDTIQASDDVLTHFVDRGYDVYEVKYKEPIDDPIERFFNPQKDSSVSLIKTINMIFSLLQDVASLLHLDGTRYNKERQTLKSSNSILLV